MTVSAGDRQPARMGDIVASLCLALDIGASFRRAILYIAESTTQGTDLPYAEVHSAHAVTPMLDGAAERNPSLLCAKTVYARDGALERAADTMRATGLATLRNAHGVPV